MEKKLGFISINFEKFYNTSCYICCRAKVKKNWLNILINIGQKVNSYNH